MEKNKKIRPIVKTHGGKFYISQFIVDNFPKNYTELKYIEGCCGGCSVLLNKERSVSEAVNDLDPSLIALIQELVVDDPSDFINSVKQIQYNKETFEWSKTIEEVDALAELVRRRFSRGGLREAFSWSNRVRGGNFGDVNAWETFKKEIVKIAKRLKGVEVYCLPVIDIISRFDAENVLFYCDPPYLPTTRQARKTYTYEMTEEDHIILAKTLNNMKGKAVLSGYQSALYTKLYKNWNMSCRPVKNHSGQGETKQSRIEVIWKNY